MLDKKLIDLGYPKRDGLTAWAKEVTEYVTKRLDLYRDRQMTIERFGDRYGVLPAPWLNFDLARQDQEDYLATIHAEVVDDVANMLGRAECTRKTLVGEIVAASSAPASIIGIVAESIDLGTFRSAGPMLNIHDDFAGVYIWMPAGWHPIHVVSWPPRRGRRTRPNVPQTRR